MEFQFYLNKITTDKSEEIFLNVKINGNWHDLFYLPKCFTCYGSTYSMENDIYTLWVGNTITNLLTITWGGIILLHFSQILLFISTEISKYTQIEK